MAENIPAAKKDLIELIEWYQKEYHKKDLGHSKLIEYIKAATTVSELDRIWDMIDSLKDDHSVVR